MVYKFLYLYFFDLLLEQIMYKIDSWPFKRYWFGTWLIRNFREHHGDDKIVFILFYNTTMRDIPISKKIVFSPVGNRIAAIFIDSLIILFPAYLITAVLPDIGKDFNGFKNFIAMLLFVIYNPVMESLGGTYGKRFVKSFTVSLKTKSPPTYLWSLARLILSILPILLMGYGTAVESTAIRLIGMGLLLLSFAPIYFSKRKQTIYDLLTHVAIIEIEQVDKKEVTNAEDKTDYIDRLENRNSAFPTEL